MKQSKYTIDVITQAVVASTSMAGVMRFLQLKPSGGMYRYIQQRVKAFGVDTSHFTGAAWSKGLTSATHKSIAAQSATASTPNAEVFKIGSTYAPGKLKKRLLMVGRPYACVTCGISDWLGSSLTLHVDHVNGDTSDNRLENLRFLCPNCHQQTPTWGSGMQFVINSSAPKRTLRKVMKCAVCDNSRVANSKSLCWSCFNSNRPTKIMWPDIDVLLSSIKKSSMLATSKVLGVSDKAVAKHLKKYGPIK